MPLLCFLYLPDQAILVLIFLMELFILPNKFAHNIVFYLVLFFHSFNF